MRTQRRDNACVYTSVNNVLICLEESLANM